MIEVKTKLGKTEVSVSGSLPMLCTDTVQIVKAIYTAIRERDEESADIYKTSMETELCKMAFKKSDKASDLDSVVEALEKLLKVIEN